jgi:hypothetical protein
VRTQLIEFGDKKEGGRLLFKFLRSSLVVHQVRKNASSSKNSQTHNSKKRYMFQKFRNKDKEPSLKYRKRFLKIISKNRLQPATTEKHRG